MISLKDGRAELFQWDTGRVLSVPDECTQVHFSNKIFGRSIDVEVVDGEVFIPDVLLQTSKDITVWAFVGTAENGYTKISKVFKVNERNKPADYVFTPTEQMTLEKLTNRITAVEEIATPENIEKTVENYLQENPVEVTEAIRTINDIAPDENGNFSLDEILFTAFVEEGFIQPVYDDESVVFTDENGVMFVYDPVNQNVKVSGRKASITVNGVEPDENGNIDLSVFEGEYEEIYEGEYEEVTSNE